MNNNSMWGRVAAVLAILLLAGGAAFAQTQSGNLYGTAVDEQGSPLPGVNVSISGNGAPQTQVTNAQGQFRFLSLSPGGYELRAELEGFSTVEFPNVNIGVGRNTTIEVTLSAAIEETITVTAESPLLDERKITTGTSISEVELEKIPTARDPWALLNQTPGVQVDRINVGGNESGQQSVFVGRGANSDANTWAVDGVDITDMAALASPTYFDFDAFEELQMTTGGSDVTIASSGVTVNVVTKRGTNEWRGSGRYFLTDGDWQSDPDIDSSEAGRNFNGAGSTPANPRPATQNLGTFIPNSIDEIEDYGVELGGAVIKDRLWIWGAYGENDINNIVGGGQVDATILENYNAKLNAQIATPNSAVVQWSEGDKIKNGRGAGPSRAPETTTDQTGPTEVSKIEDTHLFNSNFYLTGLYSLVDGGFTLTPKGGVNADVFVLDDGVYRGSYYFLINDRDVDQYRLDGSYFFNTGGASHELKFGAGYRDAESTSIFGISNQKITYSCAVAGCSNTVPGDTFVNLYRDSNTFIASEYTSGWLQDTLTLGNLTANIGLRYELASGENVGTSAPGVVAGGVTFLPSLNFPGNDPGFEYESILPRLGLTYALGAERKTLLRANYSRFAEQLPQGWVSGINPVGTSIVSGEFVDANGNGIFDAAEAGSFVRTGTSNFDPANPNSLNSPNRVDPGLDPTLTDEVNLGIDHSLLPEFVVGLGVTYRIVSDIPDLQELVVDDATGAVRIANRNDYVRQVSTVGNGPDRGSFEHFILRDGVSNAGGTFLTNGDREQEYLGVNLTFTKRLANRWMARGNLVWSDWTWNVPNSYFDHHNPTDFGNGGGLPGFGTTNGDSADGNRDGEVVAERSGGSGSKGNVLLNSEWSFNLNGLYQVAPDRPWGFNIGTNISGRQGYPNTGYRNITGLDGNTRAVQVSSDVDSDRLDDVFTIDLRLDKDFNIGDFGATVGVDAFNILNDNTVLQRERNQGSSRANFINETVSPRAFRVGLRLHFR
jgi:Carboxypeptidase regulatory-like domain/TonB-dependent Receptor Plug Domain